MNDYIDAWPGGISQKWFAEASEKIVQSFKAAKTPIPPREINRELDRVRSAILNLSPEGRTVLASREIDQWQTSRPKGTWFDSEYLEQQRKINNGGSSIDVLEDIVADNFRRNKQINAIKRRDMIARAAFVFTCCGGKLEARVKGPFVGYIEHLFTDVGLEAADCPKAVRDFLAENTGVRD